MRIYLSDNPRADITRTSDVPLSTSSSQTQHRRCVSAPIQVNRPQSITNLSTRGSIPSVCNKPGPLKARNASDWMDPDWKTGRRYQRMAGREPYSQHLKTYGNIIELVKKLRDKRSPKVLSSGSTITGPKLVVYGFAGGRQKDWPISWRYNDDLDSDGCLTKDDQIVTTPRSSETSKENISGVVSVQKCKVLTQKT